MFRTLRAMISTGLVLLAAGAALAETPPGIGGLWKWKTIVVEGPGKLRGVGGRYTAIITLSGAQATLSVAKEGYGKRDYGADAVPVGLATGLKVVADEDGSRTLDASVKLTGGKTDLTMAFSLRFVGDTVTGYWRYAPDGSTWGGLLGTRLPSASVTLTLTTPLPCLACCDILYRCGEQGPGGCNSSNECIAACAEEGAGPRACLAGDQ